jgi:hypothetical protein
MSRCLRRRRWSAVRCATEVSKERASRAALFFGAAGAVVRKGLLAGEQSLVGSENAGAAIVQMKRNGRIAC